MPNRERSDAVEDSGDLRRRSMSALGGAALIVAVDRAVQTGFLVVLARVLTPHETGVAAAVGTAVSLVLLLMNGGIPASLIQVQQLSQTSRAEACGTLLVAGLFSFLAAQMLAPMVGGWFGNHEVANAFRVAIIVVMVQPLGTVAYAGLARRLRARDAALADLFANAGSSAVIILPLALAGAGAWALVLGMIAQITFRTLVLFWFARQPLHLKFSMAAAARLYRRGFAFLVNGGLGRANADAPRWIIGRFLSENALGFYTRASSLMNYPAGLFSATVDRVIFPAVALVQDDKVRLKSGVLDALRLLGVVGLPLTAAVVILGPDIIRLVLGPQWEGAVAPFMILGFATYFRLGDRLNGVIMRGVGQPGKLAAIQTLIIALLVVGCVLGASRGLVGISLAVVIVSGVSYLVISAILMKTADISPAAWVMAHGHGIACCMLAVAILVPLVRFMHQAGQGPAATIAAAMAASAIAGGLVLALAPRPFVGQVGVRLIKSVRARHGV